MGHSNFDDMKYVFFLHIKEYFVSGILCTFFIVEIIKSFIGRNNKKNDFTYVSTRGCSVVDYAVVPLSLLPQCKNFEVITAKSLFNLAGCTGIIDQQRANVPDHSFLRWSVQHKAHNLQTVQPPHPATNE